MLLLGQVAKKRFRCNYHRYIMSDKEFQNNHYLSKHASNLVVAEGDITLAGKT